MNKTKYYKLPLYFNNIFESDGGKLEKCSEKESIDQNIEMLITTCPGEHHFDEDYGSHIWDLDFERVVEADNWKRSFTTFIQKSIESYEPRLSCVSVSSNMRDVIKDDRVMESVSVRKRVDIFVTGQINSNEEWAKFGFTIYLGPLSNQ